MSQIYTPVSSNYNSGQSAETSQRHEFFNDRYRRSSVTSAFHTLYTRRPWLVVSTMCSLNQTSTHACVRMQFSVSPDLCLTNGLAMEC